MVILTGNEDSMNQHRPMQVVVPTPDNRKVQRDRTSGRGLCLVISECSCTKRTSTSPGQLRATESEPRTRVPGIVPVTSSGWFTR